MGEIQSKIKRKPRNGNNFNNKQTKQNLYEYMQPSLLVTCTIPYIFICYMYVATAN